MDGDNNDNVGFSHNRSEGIRSCPSSGMDTDPLSEKVAGGLPNREHPFFGSGWDSLISLSQGENFGGSSMVSQFEFATSCSTVMENQRINNTSQSQLLQYPGSDSSLIDLVPRFPTLVNGSFPEMIGSFGLSEVGQTAYASGPRDYRHIQNKEGDIKRTSPNCPHSQDDCQISEEGDLGASPNGKRRKRIVDSSSPFNCNKNAERDQEKDLSADSSGFQNEKGDKKQKIEQTIGTNLYGNQSSKQSKDNTKSGEAPQENYVHMRARRGQATNSHSLAERVRREKISERMKMLQELVPGCNKITGKAVMLDEIINYVQSLQQQVEFLSMKLATVNPELNVDIEQILSKDILHSQGGSSAILRLGSGLNTNHPHSQGILQGSMPNIPNTTAQFHHMPQNLWDSDLHSLLQMGFGSNMGIDHLGL